MKHFGPSGLHWSNTCSCGGNVFWVGGCSIIIWSRFQQLHRGWETEKKYFLQSDGEFYKGVTWTYGAVKDFGCNDQFDDHKTQISLFWKGKILVRHQCLVIYDLCFTILMISCFCCRIPMGQILVCHQVLLKRPKPSEGGDHQVFKCKQQSWRFLPTIW